MFLKFCVFSNGSWLQAASKSLQEPPHMPLGIRFGLFHGCSASPYIRRQFLPTGRQKPSTERSFGGYLGCPGSLWDRLGGNISLLSSFKDLAEQLVGWQEPVLEGLEGVLGGGDERLRGPGGRFWSVLGTSWKHPRPSWGVLTLLMKAKRSFPSCVYFNDQFH